MTIARRHLLLAASAALPIVAGQPARADTTDLALICDLTLGAPLRAVAAAVRASGGVHVFVFPTAPGLIVPQLARDVQIDIVATRADAMEQAKQAGLLAGETTSGNWRDPIVIAEASSASGSPDEGKFAVAGLPGASGMDGETVAARLGVDPARIVSAIDTTEGAFLLVSGAARTGLLYLTDVRAHPRLRVLRIVPDQPPAVFAARVTKGARRPDPAAFVTWLGTPPGRAALSKGGLELAA